MEFGQKPLTSIQTHIRTCDQKTTKKREAFSPQLHKSLIIVSETGSIRNSAKCFFCHLCQRNKNICLYLVTLYLQNEK